jgi:hypothetical protein
MRGCLGKVLRKCRYVFGIKNIEAGQSDLHYEKTWLLASARSVADFAERGFCPSMYYESVAVG